MAAPAFQCEARGLSLPGCISYHTSRDIRYIFLESCRNIPASNPRDGTGASGVPHGPAPCHHPTGQHYLNRGEDCHFSVPRRLPAFLAFPTENADVRGSPEAKKRLPVFRQLCGEPVEGLKELPDARAVLGDVEGWRMVQACPTCKEA